MIPKPAQMTVGNGSLALTSGFSVGYSADLSAEMVAEIDNFIGAINKTTGLNATKGTTGLISVSADSSLPAEGYKLTVTASEADIKAATPTGLYYAFQTVKKLLPVNVAAGVAGEAGATYTLPVVDIIDSPRFEYRGFMLDVSRHFFDVAQVKRMLDIMAVYKLNRFHWHLTDDQGWRLPVAKWPLLTTEGATNNDVLLTNFETQTQVSSGTQYGPFSYTEDDIREVVAYAKARHIEVIPEIDMPGHMVAAIHAYPELSTDPEGKTYDHAIWNRGGISRDVLDVSNPRVVEFAKDVIDVLVDLFPYEYIHIGGDECYTTAWENSESCIALKNSLNLSDFHGLQINFDKQVADYAKQHGRKVMGWNELVTNGNPDMNIIKEMDPTIFCWIGGEAKCEQNGLKHIYTGFNGGYYINRSYAGYDKVGAVGDGALSTTLNVNPPLNEHCIGVQGTFWTEQVDRPTDVEYLALPRLIGIAEQGWAPVDKDTDEIMERIVADKELLDLAGYNYGAHQLVIPEYQKPDPEKWYYLSSNCSDEREGNVFEILAEGHEFITSKSGNKAQALRLWGNKKADGNEYQQFKFVEDPDNANRYAIVCRALPNGSIKSTPTGTALSDRWDYQATGLDYGFTLDKTCYAENEDGTFRYAIRGASTSAYHMNFSKSGQGQAINVNNAPNDGNGGHVIFQVVEEGETPTPPVITEVPEAGKYYRLYTRFNGPETQPRYGSVIELLQDDANKGNNAQADRLWSNAPAAKTDANYDYQWFTFEKDPAGSEYYAMVCKAKPQGSVNSTPSVANNATTARWDYDNSTKHYGFYLVDNYNNTSVQGTDNDGFYSAMTSKDAANGWYMNVSASGQGYSVHLYNNPTDQNAGIFTFEPMPEEQTSIAMPEAIAKTAEIYDLQGRRLNAPVKGVNIINGKKTIIR
ncbi:MAG: beta-N-acetylhexosaminidase [Bacteroides sp.]|nr:beta-N-acetylhexosaminidase [Bacteroides sp.]MCM1379781.1 beta-N-acetylhexosaminidase [Bacteroides sp.]MCM1446140.1 beta-N-acetylhexosaminidase [Prevotella sp.]